MQQLGPFKANADRDKIIISREDSKITIAPSDAQGVAKLVSLAMSYCAGKVLPPQLQWGGFEFRFSEDGNHVLGRIGGDGDLVVTQNNGDELIQILSASLNSHIDAVRLTAGPRRGASRGSPDPIIVGRD